MRLSLILALFAQTPDIQREIDELLHPTPWYVRWWRAVEETTGVPAAYLLPALLAAVAVVILFVVWRRRPGVKPPGYEPKAP